MYSRAYVEITNVCNMNCSFCHGTSREPRLMSLGEFARVTANLKGITEYLYFHLLGEPLSHPLLPIFIEHAARCGFKVALTTNGTLLKEKGEQLLLTKPYKINISLHSFERDSREAHLAYVNSCLDFADRASESGILVVLRLWNLSKDGVENGSSQSNDAVIEALRARFGDFESGSARGFRIKDKLHIEYGERFDWPDESEVESDLNADAFCYGLRDQVGVLVDGTVVPCCLDADGVLSLGNLFTQELDTVLSSPRARAIYDGFTMRRAVEEFCRKCPYARRFAK